MNHIDKSNAFGIKVEEFPAYPEFIKGVNIVNTTLLTVIKVCLSEYMIDN